ncbi:MAG: division/cell wall cluster transcriptional repressor MraZ [Clostridia bacterium]|nr:division/cell wall cluster transcriptional repressor MraZ [Clostridia bacterium]
MFMGTYYNSIDDKNRMIIPSKHRDQLGGRCVLTKGLDKCLYIYTLEDWAKQVEKITALPESNPEIRKFIRHFAANAVECELDKQGRICLPAELRSYAAITKEMVTVGAIRRIEIWAEEAFKSAGTMDTNEFASALEEYSF